MFKVLNLGKTACRFLNSQVLLYGDLLYASALSSGPTCHEFRLMTLRF